MIKMAGTPFDETDDAEKEFEADEEILPDSDGIWKIPGQCEAFFEENGPLKAAAEQGGRPYEYRPQQKTMAVAIAEALTRGDNLCIEAPTGVGKSFAYLIAFIYRAQLNPRPAVISTETITLQEQLIEKDIPLLKKITGLEFKAALAKGRRNYLCRRRFSLLSGEQRDALLPSPSLVLDLNRITQWLESPGIDGNRDSIDFKMDPQIWSLVCCEGGNCLGPKCNFFRSCYYFRARREWEEADIIVANHALFFTDLAMRCGEGAAGALLPNYGAVLIDEAHTLENNAAEYLGLQLSRVGMVGFLNRMFNPDNARGLLLRPGLDSLEMRAGVVAARDEVFGFFRNAEQLLLDRKESALAIPEDFRFDDLLTPKLINLGKQLQRLIDAEEDAAFRVELEAQLNRCRELIDSIDKFINRSLPEAVYYAESDRSSVNFNAAPLNVAELLREMLFNQDFPVFLCSATLTVRKSFDYFIKRTGFCNGQTLLLDSPFGKDQATIYIPKEIPDPKDDGYLPALLEQIPRFVKMTDGKAFVLFTSYQHLRHCATNLRDEFAVNGWNLLVQGESLTRFGMIREFKKDINSVLFGTDSFWTGVDVPGEALSNVIVTKLPFAVPSHPLIAARMRKIEEEGRSSFGDYSLPEAVLKFRQGVGRLIRSRDDRGIIVLLDKRLISKNYGKMFLDSVPYHVEIV